MTAQWLLALESSTARGGAALLRDGVPAAAIRLEEGQRHGRELLPAAERLLWEQSVAPGDVAAIAVSRGPGSYTGIRVGVMAAKAFAYGTGCRLAELSSLAALAETLVLSGDAREGAIVMTLQDARRDELYAGLYRIRGGAAEALEPDAAVTPEEAAARLRDLERDEGGVVCAGSGFTTYAGVLPHAGVALPGAVDPAAVGLLGWRQILREEFADPMALQPVYLRRDAGSDWRHDALISESR